MPKIITQNKTNAKSPATKRAKSTVSSCPCVFLYSAKIGTNACENAPSAKIRRSKLGSLNATKKAMTECVSGLSVRPDVVLVDAVKLSLDVPTKAIIKGDALSYSIGAASILAKVYRDRLMQEYDAIYPWYGFAQNKGYGTKDHIDALKSVGPSPIHRRTFITHFVDNE